MVRDQYRIPARMSFRCRDGIRADATYLDANLFVNALLFLFNLFLKFLYRGTVRRGAIGLEDLDIPSSQLARRVGV